MALLLSFPLTLYHVLTLAGLHALGPRRTVTVHGGAPGPETRVETAGVAAKTQGAHARPGRLAR